MTNTNYDEIQTGTPISVVKAEVGEPYAVHNKKDGSQEYEYIERISVGNSIAAENHYFLIVKDGHVIGKYMKRERPPAYDLIYQDQPNYPEYPSSSLTP